MRVISSADLDLLVEELIEAFVLTDLQRQNEALYYYIKQDIRQKFEALSVPLQSLTSNRENNETN